MHINKKFNQVKDYLQPYLYKHLNVSQAELKKEVEQRYHDIDEETNTLMSIEVIFT